MTTSFDINAALSNEENSKSYFANDEDAGEYKINCISYKENKHKAVEFKSTAFLRPKGVDNLNK